MTSPRESLFEEPPPNVFVELERRVSMSEALRLTCCDECGAFHENCYCGESPDFMDDLDCTHCGGEGTCDANANPLWDCDDNFHPCHACGGSGKRRDQRIF